MISLPYAPKILKKEGDKAVFEIEALYPGYGVTVGNSLRRVLLVSINPHVTTSFPFPFKRTSPKPVVAVPGSIPKISITKLYPNKKRKGQVSVDK